MALISLRQREDGKTPASCDHNVDVTRRTCEMAHAVGVSVEGELGCLGSLETGEAVEEEASAPPVRSAATSSATSSAAISTTTSEAHASRSRGRTAAA